ncbi:MAG: hypothetical protein HGB01_06925 [Chlorobiaceae bacterium]|nr:hypothetical protein [Chlorobiaceae bacterium]
MNPSITKPTDIISLLGTIDPASVAVGTVTSDYVDMSQLSALLAVISTGVLGASATVNAKLVQATSNAGAGKKDIAGKSITQIVKATGDNVQAEINLFAEELDGENNYQYVALELTVGTAASQASAVLLGAVHRYNPASMSNLSSVVQIV